MFLSSVRLAALSLGLFMALNAQAAPSDDKKADDKKTEAGKLEHFKSDEQTSDGSVTIGGRKLDYQAAAGTLVVHPKGWDDVPDADRDDKEGDRHGDGKDANPTAEAAMFYVAYFKQTPKQEPRPLTFFFNGGPGSASVWLHMGAFGPKRVVTVDDDHSPAAPYPVVNNEFSLLDATDMVFVDAPGTGFGRIAGKDKEKAFWGVDPDAHAFAEFITQFLSKYGRWNAPKYVFGESYGTTRAAALTYLLEADRSVDLNGVIMLSQILNFDASPDSPTLNPGIDLPYQLVLPTYAATAWYHHKLPGNPQDLKALLAEVEHFAMTDFALALEQGSALDPAQRKAVIAKLHDYTGLPTDYIDKANLRIDGGEFEKNLQGDSDTTTGRLDSRFSGPTMDPLSQRADYDPQGAAISSAYVSAFNDYVRRDLKYGEGKVYKPEIEVWKSWNFQHQPPGNSEPAQISTNVMPDLAGALKYNPKLKIMLNMGYFDLATPFFEGVYEMHHLPIPMKLQANIDYAYYESGHMVYAHEASLKAIHDNVAAFIRKTGNLPSE
ncbi:MAG TPA: peptidase S10 [Aliidongia sp.]|nr:peptidase S10 [Aliidongia sp.]